MRRLLPAALVALIAAGCGEAGETHATAGPVVGTRSALPPAAAAAASARARLRLEYVVGDGPVRVYDIGHGLRPVESFTLAPGRRGVRGVAVAPATHRMFVAFGGDGGGNGHGGVLAYDLVARRVVWSVNLASGIDSLAVSADGRLLFVPDGENSSDGVWNILSAASGANIGRITTPGSGPHDGVASADGRLVQLGDRNYNRLSVYNVGSGSLQRSVGPLVGGVRPNTVNGADTLSFTTATGFDGFQIGSLTSGSVLYTENFHGSCAFTTCSHGISLSPDSRQVAVIDAARKAVQFWDVGGAARGVAPVHLATVHVAGLEGEEHECAYDCGRDGWVQHSLDGRYVFVGDSGDVIETARHRVVAHLPALLNTRKSIEIDWRGGVPVAASGRQGVGLR